MSFFSFLYIFIERSGWICNAFSPQRCVLHVFSHIKCNTEGGIVVSQIITIDEAKRRQSFSSFEADLSVDALPVLGESSALLQDTHVEKVGPYPPRLTAIVDIFCLVYF